MLIDIQSLGELALRFLARRKDLLPRLFEGLYNLQHGDFERHGQRDDAADRGAIREVKPTADGFADVIFHLLQCPRREKASVASSGQCQRLKRPLYGPRHTPPASRF